MPYYQDQDNEIAANRSQASAEINRGLEKDIANLNKHHHALEMDYVDTHSLINDIVVDPKIFNFKNPVSSYLDECFNEDSCKNNAKDYIWWDKTHFTTGKKKQFYFIAYAF
jgi:phospholipase/lecithinase/hemolysin